MWEKSSGTQSKIDEGLHFVVGGVMAETGLEGNVGFEFDWALFVVVRIWRQNS